MSSRDEVRRWLAANHGSGQGVWLVFTKGRGRTVDYDDVVEEAICFGWVDSKSRSYDDTRTMIYLAPRRPGSKWSNSNIDRVRRLTEAGLMQPSGMAAVDEARASGAWPGSGGG